MFSSKRFIFKIQFFSYLLLLRFNRVLVVIQTLNRKLAECFTAYSANPDVIRTFL